MIYKQACFSLENKLCYKKWARKNTNCNTRDLKSLGHIFLEAFRNMQRWFSSLLAIRKVPENKILKERDTN